MKKMSRKDNAGRMSTNYPLLDSYLTLTCPLHAYRSIVYFFAVFAMLLLGGWNTQAWAATVYAKVTATADPKDTGGYVYVGAGTGGDVATAASKKLKTDHAENSKNAGLFNSSGKVSFRLSASANTNYVFKGWNTDASNNIESSNNPYDISVTAKDKSWGSIRSECQYQYYAIFARMAANTPTAGNTLAFDDTTVGEKTSAKTIKIDHAHAGTVSISLTGDGKDDFFVGATSDATESLKSFTSISEATKTLYVKFTPQNNGLRTCTLTVSSNNGLSSLTYYLKGTGFSKPSITWVDGDGNELTSGETTLSAGDVLRATCATGQTISYSDYNTSYFTTGTDANGNPILIVSEDISGTVNNLSVTANVAKDKTNYNAANSSVFSLNVTNLTPQEIEWTDDISDLSNENMPYTITLTAVAKNAKTGAASGLPITYSMASNASLSLSGNVLTVRALGGPVAITASVAGNASYAPASVTKNATVINMTDPCATFDSHSNGQFNQGGVHDIYPTLPTSVTFTAKRESDWLLKDLVITQYKANGSVYSTTTKSNDDVSTSGTQFTITSDPSVTRIRFAASSSARYTYYITGITTKRQTASSVSDNSLSYSVTKGQSLGKDVTITYSNIPVFLSFKSDEDANVSSGKSLWSLNTTHFGGCGKKGSQTVRVTFMSNAKGNFSDKLYVRNNVGDLLHTIELSASVTAQNQFLDSKDWNIKDTYLTTDQTTLSATTRAGHSNFTFTAESSNPAGIVSIVDGVMTFNASGTATIKADLPEIGVYEAFSATHNITINKATPAIATNPTVATIKYLDNLTNGEGCQLSGGKATVTLRGEADTEVDGSFEWTEKPQVVAPNGVGDYTYSVTFKPTNTGMYNNTVFDQTIVISHADASIVMNDGAVKVKIDGINDDLDECKIDLDKLIESQTTDNIAASRAGAVSYKVLSANAEYATIDGDHVFAATRRGEYTIEVTKAQTNWYVEAKDTFVVKVNKLEPVVVFDNTDNPQVIYTADELPLPAARSYNGHEIDRKINYISDKPKVVEVLSNPDTLLVARELGNKDEGYYQVVTVTASSTEDDYYFGATTDKYYKVYFKRSPHYTMDNQVDKPVSKTLHIGETATITYNEHVDSLFRVETTGENVSVSHDTENRIITVTAIKGNATGDGKQKVTLTQTGTNRLFPRTIDYTFTVTRNVSTISLEPLVTSMEVEDTISNIYTNLANTTDGLTFTCTPAGSMKYEDGKLIALMEGTNTVTFSQPNTEYWTGISKSKTITVSKKNPNVMTELANRHAWYSIIEHPFKSLNTEKELQIASSNESLAKYFKEEDKIYVYGTSGNVTFTVNQDANYKYNAVVNYQKTFEIFQPNNRLPMTLNNSNFEDYKGGYAGNVSWNDGVLCGKPNTSVLLPTTGDYLDWSAKYIILKFVGVPDKLSFDFENASSIATQYGWHFYQSSNGTDWNLIKEYQDLLMNASGGTSSGSESNLQLDPATQYIKLEYHGNYGGRFKNVHVTERKEIAPRDATKDFGLGYNGNDPTMRAITVDWYNVKPCTVTITGTDADKFVLDEGSKTINSQLDHYGTVALMVSYKHETNSETTHTATLHIEDADGNYADVTLKGQTTPAPQTIIWRNDLTPMPIEGSFQNAAMVSTGQTVTLVSDHPEVVRVVDNTTLEPVSAGTARVTATAAGNTKWAETTDYKDIEVTTLKVQYITWTDNLSNRKREEGQTVNITLTATSSAGLPITYELDEDAQAFASISGNVLRLTGWGSGQVIAKQVGNEEYVAVQTSKSLVSRNPNAKCRPLVGEYKDAYTLHTLAVKDIPIYGEPDSVTFWAKCDWDALWGMWVAEEYNGAFHDIQEISRTGKPNITSDYQYYSFPLHRNATAVRLYTKTGATMTRTFKNVEIPLAKYLELAENTMNFSQVDKGSTKTQSFYINYSNLSGVLDVEMENKENTQFTVVTTMVGEDCGDIGQNVRIDISCTGSTLGTENNTIIVHNVDQTLSIPVSATVVLPSQTITWEPNVTERNIKTTDNIVLNATATSELTVSFESSDTEVAEVIENAGVYSLDIKKYGDVTITAKQAGNDDWSAATDKPVVFHISRVVPEITTLPTGEDIWLARPLSESQLTGGVVAGNIPGSFQWVDDTQLALRSISSYPAVFVPENENYYESVLINVPLTVLANPQTITWELTDESEWWCADTIVMRAEASSGLPVTYHSSDSAVAYVVNDTLKIIKYGTVTIQAVQEGNDEEYAAASPVSKQFTLKRNELFIETLPTVSKVYVDHPLNDSKFIDNGVVKAGNVPVSGVYVWQKPDSMLYELGTVVCTAIFTPNNDSLYLPQTCQVEVTVISTYIFSGKGIWGKPSNWEEKAYPDGNDNDDVIIADTAKLTLMDNDHILLRDLRVAGTLDIQEGASMTVTGNLILEASLGGSDSTTLYPSTSGQLFGPEIADSLKVAGDVYFQMTFDPNAVTLGWYDFVVPFEVDVLGGIYEISNLNTPLKNGVDYIVMSYDESKYAKNEKYWNRYTGTMLPGRVYTITIDDEHGWKTLAFKKKKGVAITGNRSFTPSYTASEDPALSGWNGFGNGTLRHASMPNPNNEEELFVQIYDHANHCYHPYDVKTYDIAVGTSFFVQVSNIEPIVLAPAHNSDRVFAPARQEHTTNHFRLAFSSENDSRFTDHLWVSADEEAANSYEIGHDLLKLGTPGESKIAQVWTNAYGHRLCDIEMPLVNKKADCDLGIYAPKAGTYTLSIESAPENAILYLTYNGRAIWNLSMSSYAFDLSQGITEGYGLRIVNNYTPSVTTGTDEVQSEGILSTKVLINDNIYIITPDGAMYDVTGKKVK